MYRFMMLEMKKKDCFVLKADNDSVFIFMVPVNVFLLVAWRQWIQIHFTSMYAKELCNFKGQINVADVLMSPVFILF